MNSSSEAPVLAALASTAVAAWTGSWWLVLLAVLLLAAADGCAAGLGALARAPYDDLALLDVAVARADAAGVVAIDEAVVADAADRHLDDPLAALADGRLLGRTRMIHITDYACFHEQGYYTPGDTGAPVFETRAGRVGVAICYDRHYPEYMRALALAGAELVVVPQHIVFPIPDVLSFEHAAMVELVRFFSGAAA